MPLTVFINAGPWLPVPLSGYGGVETMLRWATACTSRSAAPSRSWFEYWAGRFEAIWDAAREPGADGRVALNRVPADRTDNPEARPQ
jgi:hypothetical protein